VTVSRRSILLVLAVLALYGAHQDFWFRDLARPLVFGFLPIGLVYHVVLCLAITGLMWVLVRYAWPVELERTVADRTRSSEERS
jgi:hypothetical protein